MISVAPYWRATSQHFFLEPTAKILPAPINEAPATDIKPTGPIPITQTVSPNLTLASSAPWKPVVTISQSITAWTGVRPSGIRAKLASASLTWKYSAKTPSLKLENFQPPSIPPECIGWPSCAAAVPQSGVMAGTITLSPGLKSLTSEPTLTTWPTASWPRIISWRSPMAPAQTVWISDEHGARANGRTIASSGPHSGTFFVIHPALPMPSMAKPFIVSGNLYSIE